MARRDYPLGFPVRPPVGWRPPPPPAPPAPAFSPLKTALLVLFMMAVCAGVGLLTVSLPRRPRQSAEAPPVVKPMPDEEVEEEGPSASPARALSYEKDILPIMRKSCNNCHAGKTRRAGVDLSSLAGVKRGGDNGPVVKPGRPADSPLYDSIVTGRMPPRKPTAVSQKERELVRAWIEAGAK